MEKKHRCRLCFRNFANGRALGGHMRSHMMKFYAEEKASKQEERGGDKKEEEEEEEEEEQPFDEFHSYSSTSSPPSFSSSDEEEEDDDDEEGQENPGKSTVLVDHDFSVVLQDRESETESSKRKKSICRRSKRVRKSRISDFNRFSMDGFFQVKRSKFNNECSSMVETEPLSSISDTTPEEHVAHCLIMLSKDKWEKEETEYLKEDDDDEQEEEEEKKFGDDYSEDSGVAKAIKTKVRGKYKCESCNKLFRSYQALGGHRASHKKIKAGAAAAAPRVAEGSSGSKTAAAAAAAVVVEKIHQCPFCERIFSSGQALGGHKRSHFIGGSPISRNCNPIKQKSRIAEAFNIDLNLPAPVDDDETSQIAVSAVSDAEFVHPIKQ